MSPQERRTLAGDMEAARTALHYLLALLVAEVRRDPGTHLAVLAVIFTPTIILYYALFR